MMNNFKLILNQTNLRIKMHIYYHFYADRACKKKQFDSNQRNHLQD